MVINHILQVVNTAEGRLAGLKENISRGQSWGLVLFLPAFLFLTSFILVPVLYVFYLSLFELSILEIGGTFTGLNNYVEVISSTEFYISFWLGIVFAAGTVMFQLIIGLFLALALNHEFRGSSLVRTLAILPYLVPVIAVVLMWRWMANPVYGILNHYGMLLGFWSEPINFFGSINLAMPSVIIATSWKYISFCVLIFLARLQSIDDTLYEQAKISGAGYYQMFRTVTLPNLWNVILLVVLLRMVWMFNKFGDIWLFTQGGPLGRTRTFPVYIYETTFREFHLGLGSSMAIILFVILSFTAAIYFWRFEPSKEIETTR